MSNTIIEKTRTRNAQDEQIERLANYIENSGLEQIPLPKEFYYASLPLCIIDAVFSIGVTYTSTRNTVDRFCERQNWNTSLKPHVQRLKGEHSIKAFLNLLEGQSSEQIAIDLFGNRQRTSSRSGILKAEAVQCFAMALKSIGIDDFADQDASRLSKVEVLVKEIPGQSSGISFDYFRMLAGDETLVKPDRMVQRYIVRALNTVPKKIDPGNARSLLLGASELLTQRGREWSPRTLDYAIWNMESQNA
jgi:hypothetical protein